MRHLSLALPLCLLMASSHAAGVHEPTHGSLPAHQHGSAELDAVLSEGLLEIELRSPAVNLLGFEHPARSQAEQSTLAAARGQLEQPDVLFGLPTEATCQLADASLQSPLFEAMPSDSGHSDILARYRYTCAKPGALHGLSLDGLFKAFPGIQQVQVQLIGPRGQQGMQASQAHGLIRF